MSHASDHPSEDNAAPSSKKADAFVYSGRLDFEGASYAWRQSSRGEVVLQRILAGHDAVFKPIGDFHFSKKDELAVINGILSDCRQRAMPDDNGYFAAAAAITRDGHLFVSANNEVHIKDPYTGRGCAETSALRKSQDGTHDRGVKLDALYLMSGRAKSKKDGQLEDKNIGHVACLCGECRENVREHVDEKTRMVMIPTNDRSADLSINNSAAYIGDLKPNEAWRVPYETMYPLPKDLLIAKSQIADIVRKGALMVMNADAHAPALDASMPALRLDGANHVRLERSVVEQLMKAYQRVDMRVPALEMNGGIENVNKAMLRMIKDAYNEHAAHVPKGKNIKITAVLLKTDEGKFYPGICVEGDGWLPSKPQIFANALANAKNHVGLSDAYMMTFDSDQLTQEMQDANHGTQAHRMPMASPAGLGRLIKNMKNNDNPQLTVIPINDGSLSAEMLREYSSQFYVRDAFGPEFTNPKSEFSRSVSH